MDNVESGHCLKDLGEILGSQVFDLLFDVLGHLPDVLGVFRNRAFHLDDFTLVFDAAQKRTVSFLLKICQGVMVAAGNNDVVRLQVVFGPVRRTASGGFAALQYISFVLHDFQKIRHIPLFDKGFQFVDIYDGRFGMGADKRPSDPLQKKHIPDADPAHSVVTLSSITHHAGVNALAPEQTIEFGPGLTIIYGDNAAGKSGYTRVLKRACRARGAEEILGNVLSGSGPGRLSATIRFKAGNKEELLEWADQEVTHHPLGSVSVFDSHCAAVYLREKTDVAFRPFALDLFDKLSDACEAVRAVVDKERASIDTAAALPSLTEGTAASALVSHITSLTKPDDVKALGSLSEGEKQRLDQLRHQIKDLESDDPQKTARALNLRAQRLDVLATHLKKLTDALTDDRLASVFDSRAGIEAARTAVRKLHGIAFPPELLPGTGSEVWRALWETARRFSTTEAYPARDFPVTDDHAKCLLCQQDLRDASPERLQRFEEFIRSTLQ